MLGLGLALIALAALLSSRQAVASIFAFSGVATAVLGVLLSRLEGRFELSITRLVANFRAARNAGTREDLTFEERANLIFKLLEISGDATSPAPTEDRPKARPGADQRRDPAKNDPSLPRPINFAVTGETDRTGAVAVAFERHVACVFEGDGWEVESSMGTDRGFDFVARRDGVTAYVGVKLRRRVSAADIRQARGTMEAIAQDPSSRYVLVVNAGALSGMAREELSRTARLEVLEVPIEGW
jgi:hypothetical protein